MSVFYNHNKVPSNQLIKRTVFFWLSFGGFSPWSVGTIAFGPVAKLYIMAGSAQQKKLLT
jgi:hypothetical protein